MCALVCVFFSSKFFITSVKSCNFVLQKLSVFKFDKTINQFSLRQDQNRRPSWKCSNKNQVLKSLKKTDSILEKSLWSIWFLVNVKASGPTAYNEDILTCPLVTCIYIRYKVKLFWNLLLALCVHTIMINCLLSSLK